MNQIAKASFVVSLFYFLLCLPAYGNVSETKPRTRHSENRVSELKTNRKQQKRLVKLQNKIAKKQHRQKDESGFKVFLKLILLPLTVIGGLVKLFTIIIGAEISIGALILISLGIYGIIALGVYIIFMASLGNK